MKKINFNDIKYERPNYDLLEEKIDKIALEISKTSEKETFCALLTEFQKDYQQSETMGIIAYIRSYLDGTDKKYNEEMSYTLSHSASIDSSPIYEAIMKSPFKTYFEEKYGSFLLNSCAKKKSLYIAGQEYMVREQEILAEYHSYISEMKFLYDGKMISEAQINILKKSEDEATRKAAIYAWRKGYADNGEQLGDYLNELIEVRNKLAQANGFKSYLEYSNVEKERYSFGEPELEEFCRNVKKYILPLVEKNNKKIKERLKLEKYTTDDTGRFFPDGNAKPIGNVDFIKEKAQEMFDDMDPEFGDIYRQMKENGYINIDLSDNKVIGMGFATQIYDEQIPFIFGNYLGDDRSVTTFLHECGHAIQMQLSMNKYDLQELYDQVQDLSELPSKTMELLTYEYAQLFFGNDSKKYIEGHLSAFLEEISNYCMIHEFETFIYGNPKASKQERIDKFNELAELYSPGVEFLNPELRSKGYSLYCNSVVYMFVRYVISYSLSDLSAIYLANEFKKDRANGIALFKKLGEIGGTMDYCDAIAFMGLRPAYSEDVIKEVASYLQEKLSLE